MSEISDFRELYQIFSLTKVVTSNEMPLV
jgi:hypothetical protein